MDHPSTFRTTVHGTVFGERAARVEALRPGTALLLIPDPPMEENPSVWVHSTEGDPLGHLPADINSWLVPWMLTETSGSRPLRNRRQCHERDARSGAAE